MLHEFFIETQMAESGFDDSQLIFVVIDAEAPRESGANLRQRLAIAAQQTHAERMKRG